MIIIFVETVLIQSLCLLSLVVFVMGSLLIQSSDAILLPKTNLDHYIENDVILVGTINSVTPIPEKYSSLYEVSVDKFLKKNSQIDDKKIIVYGGGFENNPKQPSVDKIFKYGDRVILFIKIINEKNTFTLYSFSSNSFDPDRDFILPPLQLSKAGLKIHEITCKSDFTLVEKSSVGTPACIKTSHLQKISERGWVGYVFPRET